MEKDRIKKFYKKLFSINEIEKDYKASKYVLMFIWIFLSVFTCIEIRNAWEVFIFYFRGIIILLFTYFYFSTKIYFSKTPIFESLEDYLGALEETIYKYSETRELANDGWKDKLIDAYKKHYGVTLNIPRWMDIESKYRL